MGQAAGPICSRGETTIIIHLETGCPQLLDADDDRVAAIGADLSSHAVEVGVSRVPDEHWAWLLAIHRPLGVFCGCRIRSPVSNSAD
jgi:hypothetical protein